MKKFMIFILFLSLNTFALYFRETYSIVDEKGKFLGKKVAIASDEGKFYCQMISIYSIDNYYFLIEMLFPCEFMKSKGIPLGKKISTLSEKDSFISIILNIKGNEIEKYYQFIFRTEEGFTFSNCGKKSNLSDIYNILNGSQTKQIRDFLDILLNDEYNVFGLIFSEFYKPKSKYNFLEMKMPCGELENIFSLPCSETIRK